MTQRRKTRRKKVEVRWSGPPFNDDQIEFPDIAAPLKHPSRVQQPGKKQPDNMFDEILDETGSNISSRNGLYILLTSVLSLAAVIGMFLFLNYSSERIKLKAIPLHGAHYEMYCWTLRFAGFWGADTTPYIKPATCYGTHTSKSNEFLPTSNKNS